MVQSICQNSKQSKYFLCMECINCKTKNGMVYCIENFFSEKNKKSLIYMPTDFDCYDWEEA